MEEIDWTDKTSNAYKDMLETLQKQLLLSEEMATKVMDSTAIHQICRLFISKVSSKLEYQDTKSLVFDNTKQFVLLWGNRCAILSHNVKNGLQKNLLSHGYDFVSTDKLEVYNIEPIYKSEK